MRHVHEDLMIFGEGRYFLSRFAAEYERDSRGSAFGGSRE
jgi:hypothetical protein